MGALHIRMGLPAGLFAREVLQPMFEVRSAGVCGRLTFPLFSEKLPQTLLLVCTYIYFALGVPVFALLWSAFRGNSLVSRITFSERNTLSARIFTRRPGGVPQGLRFVQEGKRSRYQNHSIALLTHLFFLEQLAHVSTRTQGNVSLTAQAISPFPQHKTHERLESPPPPPSPSVQRKRGRISRPREPGQRGDTVRRGADAN